LLCSIFLEVTSEVPYGVHAAMYENGLGFMVFLCAFLIIFPNYGFL
jgi:hypothetical protein